MALVGFQHHVWKKWRGRLFAARNLINRGCQHCPKSEDVWLEAIRLHMSADNHNSKVIAANALENNPRSVKLWIAAMELERDQIAKKRVVRKALDQIPQSVALWKTASNLENDPADARMLLARATDFIPLSIELWLALARLESPDNARKVLNKARKAVPTSYEGVDSRRSLRGATGQCTDGTQGDGTRCQAVSQGVGHAET